MVTVQIQPQADTFVNRLQAKQFEVIGIDHLQCDGSKAMAVYGANKNVGGSVSEMRLYKFIGGGCLNGTGEFDIATSKFTVLRHGAVGSGTKYFNNWVMSGSVDQIKGYMNTLRSWGAA